VLADDTLVAEQTPPAAILVRRLLHETPCHLGMVDDAFPSPTLPVGSRAEVFLGYLDYFRARIIAKVDGLGDHERRRSRLQPLIR
jgi:hypothetical protein